MAKCAYIATIQIAVIADSEGQAMDGITETLTPLKNGFFLDWSYLKIGGQWCYPTFKLIPDSYEEGDAF